MATTKKVEKENVEEKKESVKTNSVDKAKKKAEYDFNLASEFANKIKSKLRFSLNVTGQNGYRISKKEEEAMSYGFNYAIESCVKAINEVLQKYNESRF